MTSKRAPLNVSHETLQDNRAVARSAQSPVKEECTRPPRSSCAGRCRQIPSLLRPVRPDPREGLSVPCPQLDAAQRQPGRNTARLVTDGGNIQVLANGPLLNLPAGALYVSAKVGDVEARADSSAFNMGLSQSQILSRNDASAQLNLDLPLASRTRNVFGALGELSVNMNSQIDYLSDFGALPTLGFGINWTPIPGYNLIVSETHDHQAPTLTQLDGPVVQTPGVRLFDYETGQTVMVTQISGGNHALVADDRHVVKVGVTLKPLPARTAPSPPASSGATSPTRSRPCRRPAHVIEMAFPNRFVRAPDGELEEEDNRPLNFASQGPRGRCAGGSLPRCRWANSRPARLRPPGAVPQAASGRRAAVGRAASVWRTRRAGQGPRRRWAASPERGTRRRTDWQRARLGITGRRRQRTRRRPRWRRAEQVWRRWSRRRTRAAFGGGPPVGGQFQVAVYHTVIFKDQFTVAAPRPGARPAGRPQRPAGGTGNKYQQEVEAQMGYTNAGYGARMSADWRSATVVTGGASGGAGNLDFSSVATVNLRLWDDFRTTAGADPEIPDPARRAGDAEPEQPVRRKHQGPRHRRLHPASSTSRGYLDPTGTGGVRWIPAEAVLLRTRRCVLRHAPAGRGSA